MVSGSVEDGWLCAWLRSLEDLRSWRVTFVLWAYRAGKLAHTHEWQVSTKSNIHALWPSSVEWVEWCHSLPHISNWVTQQCLSRLRFGLWEPFNSQCRWPSPLGSVMKCMRALRLMQTAAMHCGLQVAEVASGAYMLIDGRGSGPLPLHFHAVRETL